MLGDERLQPRETEHLTLRVVRLYQPVAVEQHALALLQHYLLLLIAHPRHEPWPPILLASTRISRVSVVSSRRRYRAAFRLDEPVFIVSSRCAPTMLSTFPEADPGSTQDAAGGSPGSDIANSLYPATSSTCRYLMPLRSIQCRPRL